MPAAAPSTAETLATAEASAAAGVARAQLGYELTTQTLNASVQEAVTIFPLLALEAAAIAEGFATFAATRTAWEAAQKQAQASLAQAGSHPGPPVRP